MNILFLTNHLNIGGITSYVLNLAKGLRLRGHNVYLASSGGEVVAKFCEAGIACIDLPINTKCEVSPKILFSFFKLRAYFREKELDIIHANTRVTSVLGCLLNKFLDKPYISTCHGFFKIRIFRKIFPCWGRRVIAISEAVKEHLAEGFRVEREKIRVIRHGIDVAEHRTPNTARCASIKKKLGLKEGPVVGIIARLSEEKGHIYLIEAIKKSIQKMPDIQLLIVGRGRLKNQLLGLTKKLGLEENIFFLEPVLNSEEILSAIDVFVLSSSQEGLGLSLMEAMGRGLAVIGSDIGGIRDLIQNEVSGLLVKPQNPEALASAIIEILADPEKKKSLGENAMKFIKQDFSAEKMVIETERVYLECLSQKE